MIALPLVCLLAQTSEAPARLAILPAIVPGPYGQSSVQDMYESVSDGAKLRLRLQVTPFNEIFVDGAETIASQVKACGSDRACTARALRLAHLDLGLEVIANFALDPPLVTISLIDADKEATLGESVVELATGEPLDERLGIETQVLLDKAGHAKAGEVLIRVSPSDSTIVFAAAERPQPGSPGAFMAPPGTHRLEVIHSGYLAEVRQLEVLAGRSQIVEVRLNPVQGEAGFVGSPLFWGTVGLVAVAAATTVVVLALGGPGSPDCLCIATAASPCGTCQ